MPSTLWPATPWGSEDLGAAAETAWDQLRAEIDLADGFWLTFIFTDSAAVAEAFHQRATRVLAREVRQIDRFTASRPDELSGVAAWAEARSRATGLGWLDTGRAWRFGDPDQSLMAWNNTLRLLNERRDRLRGWFPHGLVILLPTAMRGEVSTMAPDLWSIRNLVLDASGPSARSLSEVLNLERPSPDAEDWGDLAALVLQPPDRVAEGVGERLRRAEVALSNQEWGIAAAEARGALDARREFEADQTRWATEVVKGRQPLDANRMITTDADRAQTEGVLALACLGLDDPGGAVDHALRALRAMLPLGAERTLRLLDLIGDNDHDGPLSWQAHQADVTARAARATADPSPERLRDHSLSLQRLGDLAQRRGELATAHDIYQQSLAQNKQLRTHHGDTPERRRDHSYSLIRLGDIAEQHGDLITAVTRYGESLPIARNLAAAFPDVPRYIDDLAVTERRLAELRANLAEQGESGA